MKNLILGSTSIYRAQLLQKLGIPFQAVKPLFDEDAAKTQALKEKLTPIAVAEKLSCGKAESLRPLLKTETDVIIAGDQLVHFEQKIIGKSKNHEKAFEQLSQMQGKTHELITAVTLLSSKKTLHLNHITRLTMKKLSPTEITAYLHMDEPYDCAGSYKIENAGVALFSEIECNDFSAIQGLPLIWLSTQLKELGYELFKKTNG